MDREFEKLIEAIVADGVVTDKEKAVLYRAADRLGVDHDTADVLLEGALQQHLQVSSKTAEEKMSNADPSSHDSCPACGASVDPIFSNCPFCKSPIPNLGKLEISTSELITLASEWLSAVRSGSLTKVSDGRVVSFPLSEIKSNAAKYLNLLKVRSAHSPEVSTLVAKMEKELETIEEKKNIFSNLGSRMEENNMKQEAQLQRYFEIATSRKGMIGAALFLTLILFMQVSTCLDERNLEEKWNSEVQRIEMAKTKIESAISNGDLESAELSVFELSWDLDIYSRRGKNKVEAVRTLKEFYLGKIEKLKSDDE